MCVLFFFFLVPICCRFVVNLNRYFTIFKQDHASVLVDGTCQIPDPVYKLVGSIVCFYIPLGVMLITYWSTVRLLARQQQSLCSATGTSTAGANVNSNQSNGWAGAWLGQQTLGKKDHFHLMPESYVKHLFALNQFEFL